MDMHGEKQNAHSTNPTAPGETGWDRLYRYRWPLALALLAGIGVVVTLGARRLSVFSKRVDSFKSAKAKAGLPKLFDARFDIWFDPQDTSLRTYRQIEAKFVADDTVLIAFEDKSHPWGVFNRRALDTIARLTAEIEKVPLVRRVRSLTSNPWIRWGPITRDENGLLVGDLFVRKPSSTSKRERLERMVAVLGYRRAAKLVGAATLERTLGAGPRLSKAIGEPRLLRGIITPDGRTVAIQVQLLRPKVPRAKLAATLHDDPGHRAVAQSMHGNESQWRALDGIRAAIARAKSPYALHIAGMPSFERNFMDVGLGDMKLVVVMFGVIALTLLVIFRRRYAVAIPLLMVTASLLGMMGVVWLMGDLLNNLTALAPNMLTAIAIANAIHLVAAYLLLRPQAASKQALIVAVIKKNALPVLLTSVTTAVGFFSLTVSEIVPMRMLGYTGGIATLIAYVATMTLVPALLSLVPFTPTVADAAGDGDDAADTAPGDGSVNGVLARWSDRLVDFVQRRRRAIVAVSVVLIAVAGVGLARVQISSDFRAMFPESNRVISDLTWIEKRLGGTGDLELVFSGKRRIASSYAFLAKVARFEARLRREMKDPQSPLRFVTKLDSALDVLRKMHQVQHGNRAAYYRLPTPADVPLAARTPQVDVDPVTGERRVIPAQTASTLIAQYYLQYENGAKPAENLSRLVTADRRSFRITARLAQAPSLTHQAAFARIRHIAATSFPAIAGDKDSVASGKAMATLTLTGKLYLFANMVQRFSYAFIASISIALVVITVLITILFRSWRLGLVSLIPNVLPLLLPLGVFSLLGLPLDGPAVIVVSVALGICVDDTIHFFSNFVRARKEGADSDGALRAAFRGVGGALTATTLVLVLGFAVLAFSDFRPNVMIGQLAVAMIAIAWVADFIVTPAFLSLLMPDAHSSDEAPDATHTEDRTMKSKTRSIATTTAAAAASSVVAAAVLVLVATSPAHAENTSGVAVPPQPAFKRGPGYGAALARYLDRFDSGWKDAYAQARMTLYDANGDSVQRRVIQLIREGQRGDKSVIKFLSPADIRGVAALIHEHPKSSDDSWLYLPASRRVRRISGANRTASFQGTEFTYEDLSSLVVAKYRWRYLGETRGAAGQRLLRLEARPTYRDTGYSKLVVALDPTRWRVERIDFFDRAGQKLKVLTADRWTHYHGRFWRARRLTMRNVQTRKKTVLEMTRQYVNLALYKSRAGRSRGGLAAKHFTRRALAGR